MESILSYVGSLALRSLALPVLALAAIAILRVRTAAARHAVWTAVVAGMLLLAVLAPFAPAIPLRILSAPHVPVQDQPFTPAARTAGAPQPAEAAIAPRFPTPSWQQAAAGLYLLAAAILLARMLFGYLFTRRLFKAARLTDLGPDPIYESTWISVPLTAGYFRPKILLPADWHGWRLEKLAAVLAHERTHVRRADWGIALLAGVNRCVYWFHPLAWWLERRLAALAEHACDDAALLETGSREPYAQALVDMAAAARNAQGRLVWEAMAMARASEVRMRLERILDESRQIPREPGRRKWALLAACSLPLIYFAAVLQIEPALAQTQTQTAQRSAVTQWPEVSHMNGADVTRMEQQLAANPDDLQTRSKLIAYYFLNNVREPRLSHILWLIEHHPESAEAAFNSGGISPLANSLNTVADYTRAASLWRQQAAAHPADEKVLLNAAQFFSQPGVDWSEAERILTQAEAAAPESFQVRQRLAVLYSRALSVSTDSSGALHFPAPGPSQGFAQKVINELQISKDAQLLADVAGQLFNIPRDADDETKRVLQPRVQLGEKLVARAKDLGVQTARLPMSPSDIARISESRQGPMPLLVEKAPPVLSKIDPDFPQAARDARISAMMRLMVEIGTDGRVSNANLMMGHPLLANAAVAAVKQWVFAPVIQNGVPVAARFRIDIPMTWNGAPFPPPPPAEAPAGAAQQAKPPAPSRIRVGGNVQAHMIVSKVDPIYPEQARTAGPEGGPLQGTVTLQVLIGEDGHVQTADPVEGHPLLAAPAVEAVKQYVYKPTLLNGNPVSVVTTVEVPFSAK